MFVFALACEAPAPRAPPPVPSTTTDTHTDTVSEPPPPPPTEDGWGTCASLRSLGTWGSTQPDALLVTRAGPDGADDWLGRYDGPLALPDGLTLTPRGERAWVAFRTGADGAIRWALALDGTSQAELVDLVAAPDGGVYVGGSADALTSFAGGAPIGGMGEADGFVARVSAEGAVLWTATFGSAGDDGVGGLAPSSDGGVVVHGYFAGPGLIGEQPLALADGAELGTVVARFDADGALEWAGTASGATSTKAWGAATSLDGQRSFALGAVVGAGATPLGDAVVTGGVYVAQHDADGVLRWAAPIGPPEGAGSTVAHAVRPLPLGEVLVSGDSAGPTAFAADTSGAVEIPESEGSTVWLARYDVNGHLERVSWASASGAADANDVSGLADGGAVWVGRFTEQIVLGPGEPREARFVGEDDGFVARLDAFGSLVCAVHVPAVDLRSVRVLPDGGVLLVGEIAGGATFPDGLTVEGVEGDMFHAVIDLL